MKMKKERKSQGEVGMCTKNGSYCEKAKNREGGGGDQGRYERRSEAFVKIQKKKCFFFFFFIFGGGGQVGGVSGWM